MKILLWCLLIALLMVGVAVLIGKFFRTGGSTEPEEDLLEWPPYGKGWEP